jgi:hypothetical protein
VIAHNYKLTFSGIAISKERSLFVVEMQQAQIYKINEGIRRGHKEM